MGVSHGTYFISWLTYYWLNGLLVSVLMVTLLKLTILDGFLDSGTIIEDGYNIGHIYVLYYLYCTGTIGFMMVLCTFFQKAKTAGQATTFISVLLNFLYFFRFLNDFAKSNTWIHIASIIPQNAFNFGMSTIAFTNDQMRDLNFTYEEALTMLGITTVGYTLLAIYLDLVWPNEMGTNKHPLFFIRWIWRSNQATEKSEEIKLLSHEEQEEQVYARYEQEYYGTALKVAEVRNVHKHFGKKKAVNGVSFNFHESEVFCLLGHNGAGKSTTINLLTGMLGPTSGDINIMGMNYADQVD